MIYVYFKSLEELAQQSKINYTVVEDSPYYEYFKNMAGAEEDLYKYDLLIKEHSFKASKLIFDDNWFKFTKDNFFKTLR